MDTDISARAEADLGSSSDGREAFGAHALPARDYISNMEFGYWDELKAAWLAEGHLPAVMRQADGSIPDELVERYFGIEQFASFSPRTSAFPLREREIVEETETTVTFCDGIGVLQQFQRAGRGSRHIRTSRIPVRDLAPRGEAFRDECLDVDIPPRLHRGRNCGRRDNCHVPSAEPVQSVDYGIFISALFVTGRIRESRAISPSTTC
jgi:hypothetical protein